jgi:hypothetical protein
MMKGLKEREGARFAHLELSDFPDDEGTEGQPA